MASKRKLMQEGKQYLLEKIHNIEERQNWIVSAVQHISAQALEDAKKLLAETDKKKFSRHFQQVNASLETSLSTLMLLKLSVSCCENDDGSDSDSSTDSEADTSCSKSKSEPVPSSLSTATASKISQSLGDRAPSLSASGVGPSGDARPFMGEVKERDPKAGQLVGSGLETDGEERSKVPPGFQASGGLQTSSVRRAQEPMQHSQVPSKDKSGPLLQVQKLHQDAEPLSDCMSQPDRSVGKAMQETAGATRPVASAGTAHASAPQMRPSQAPSGPPPPDNQRLPIQARLAPAPCRIAREKQKAVIMPLELKTRSCIELVVSDIINPSLFWVQLADCPMASFSQKLNEYYCSHPDIPIPAPYVGTFCAACFTQDNCWYRARIVVVHGEVPDPPTALQDPARVRVDVMYVDFGNRERLSLTRVRVLHPDFTKLRAQTICCSLAKVKPPAQANAWLKEHTEFFRALVLHRIVQAVVTVHKDLRWPQLDMSVPVSTGQPLAQGHQHVHVNVAQVMVERYMAQYVEGCGPPEMPLQPQQHQPHTASNTPSGSSLDPSTDDNTEKKRNEVGAQQASVQVESPPPDHSSARGSAAEKNDRAFHGDCSAARPNRGMVRTHGSNQRRADSSQEKPDTSGTEKHAKAAGESPSPDESPPLATTDSMTVALSGQQSVRESGSRSDRGGRGQGAWSGRGKRSSNPSHQATPQQKNEQQTHRGAQPAKSASRERPATPQPARQQRDKESGQESTPNPSSRAASLGGQLDQFSDATELGRGASPNSSSGNSGQSDSGIGLKTAVRPRGTPLPSDNRFQEPGSLPQAETSPKDGITQNCSDVLRPKQSDGDGMPDQRPEEDNSKSNKPMGAPSDNLSSSTSSFQTALTEDDSCHTSGLREVPASAPPPAITRAGTEQTASSPSCPNLQLKKRESLPMQNGCIRLAMSHIVHPQEFYVHLVTLDATKLDYLAAELNSFYDSEEAGDMLEKLVLQPGAYCAVRYTADMNWYRAKILAIRDSEDIQPTEGDDSTKEAAVREVQVMYVDYGNTEWQQGHLLRPLQALFYELPGQVIKCCLDHIGPPKDEKEETSAAKSGGALSASTGGLGVWSEEAIREFTALTGYEKLLLGRLSREYVPNSEEPLKVMLLDPTDPVEVCINQELVNHGLASSNRLVPAKPQEETRKAEGIADTPEPTSSEGWHLKKYMEGGYDPAPVGPAQSAPPKGVVRSSLTDTWNPMRNDFESNRNSYDIDVDDPGVATVGYKAESTRQLCRYFSSGRLCYRGDQCPYEHAKIGEKPIMSVEVFYSNNRVQLPPLGSMVALEVTALYDAFHFWAQLPYAAKPLDSLQQQGAPCLEDEDGSEETLEMLEESLNATYSASKPRQASSLLLRGQGEIVCCRCPSDQRYYRARVLEVNTKLDTVQVFYVDYGNTDWVPLSDIHDIQPQFLHLPFQAVECFLAGVRPLDYSIKAKANPDQARKLFEELACSKTLVAHVVYVLCSGTIDVELFDTSGKSEINIAEALIENQLAVREGDRLCEDPPSLPPCEDEAYSSEETNSSGVIFVPG